MSLVTKLFDQVDPEARKEGGRIRARGDVDILEHSANRIDAAVFAGATHGVLLEREKHEVLYSCDCNDYANSLDPCKHVWATLLEAEAFGYLAGWERGEYVDLMPADEDDAGFDEEDEDEEDDDSMEPAEVFAKPVLASKDAAMKRSASHHHGHETKKAKDHSADWKTDFNQLRRTMQATPAAGAAAWPAGKELLYVVDVEASLSTKALTLEVMSRDRKRNGEWGKPKREALSNEDCDRLPDPVDQSIVAMLTGARQAEMGYYYSSYGYRSSRFRPHHSQHATLLQQICGTGRCFLRVASHSDLLTLKWDDEARWEFKLKIERSEQTSEFVISGELQNGPARMKLSDPLLLIPGVLFTREYAARFEAHESFAWVALLRERPNLHVPAKAGEELLSQMLSLPQVPHAELPQELQYERIAGVPKFRLRLRKDKERYYYSQDIPKLNGELSFDYDGHIVKSDDTSPGIYLRETRRFIARDREAERAAEARLHSLGFREARGYYYDNDRPKLQLSSNQLPSVIRVLTGENWFVEAEGQLYRQPGEIRVELSSGIDWFELHGTADFGDQQVALPELLRALQRGEKTIRLGDGTFGILPEDWLKKYGLLAGMGEAEGDHIKFGKTQIGLLDALLAAQPQITCDEVFEKARQQLRAFEGVKAADAPPTFVGTLRPYQREGLGWLEFLRNFSFGGCLADDMGLGKTVQVLALLEERRLLRAEHASSSNGNGTSKKLGPSLVVAPRSLIFNWVEEARRFSPQLRVIDHTGTTRAKTQDAFNNTDLVLTTYGTMRNDIAFLKDVAFDYVVLDEAQAIKNASSESAKASRLLSASHRLALSGTPVQNHLGELWSLFEFLNPGMLGSAKVLQMTASASQKVDHETKTLLSRALRPFILRRTKAQVAKELPQRVEQTIHCELDASQRKLYDELREHYRQSLLMRIATEGIKKSKIQILEALLRLRQAACHPGLIDKEKTDLGSAKLDSLLPQLAEVMDGGHKALVFSQFTSFLSIVRKRLDADKVHYEYLDGRTRDRQAVVDRFQNDKNCKLFLISLKAGGVGLNLTAAEYVFLLDPWWNPAVEAQAIDRAHRIGQTRQVFAYRLIAKDTVEEKVLKLQESKRELADAIVSADNSVISKLGREDLELLLS